MRKLIALASLLLSVTSASFAAYPVKNDLIICPQNVSGTFDASNYIFVQNGVKWIVARYPLPAPITLQNLNTTNQTPPMPPVPGLCATVTCAGTTPNGTIVLFGTSLCNMGPTFSSVRAVGTIAWKMIFN